MSIRCMTKVWDSQAYEGGDLLVLLALADWADDAGKCWPSVPAIARKARLTERQVYNILRKMRASGAVSYEPGGGRGNPSVYVVNTETISGFTKPLNPEIRDRKTLKSTTVNPEICDNPPHPLIGRTVIEPSLDPPREKTAEKKNTLTAAVDHVCLEGTFVGQELRAVIGDAIQQATKHPDCALRPMELAKAMARRWGEYQGDVAAGVLRYVYSPAKFFAGGHWRLDAVWPYDHKQLRMRQEAALGATRR